MRNAYFGVGAKNVSPNAGYVSMRLRRLIQSPGLALSAVLATVFLLISPASAADDQLPSGQTPQGVIKRLPPGVTPQQALDILKQKEQAGVGGAQGAGPQADQSRSSQQIYVSSTPAVVATTSALESAFSARAGRQLKQFGYDLVGNGGTPWIFNDQGAPRAVTNGGTVSNPQIGAVQDDYILGPGDTITVTLRGQENATYDVVVGRNGTVTLPNIAPLSAAGRSFGEFRADVERGVASAFLQTKVYMSVSQVRQLSVRVVGEVTNPGVYAVTGLSTVLDALNLAGGVQKTGSLRNITVVRGNRSFKIDLYSLLLTHGRTVDVSVAQGDRIVVPAIGATVAVVGDIRRSAIYELPGDAKAITASSLLSLANGTNIRGVYRSLELRIRPDGKQEFVDITAGNGAAIRDGEILFVEKSVEDLVGRVTLEGAVRLPGNFALGKTKTLHDLLPSIDVFAPQPYLLLGVIDRLDRQSLQRVVIPFSPLRVVRGQENKELVSGDRVRILTIASMRALAGGGPPVQGAKTDGAGAPGSTPITGTNRDSTSGTDAAHSPSGMSQFSTTDVALLGHFLGEARIELQGAVNNPGVFLIAPGTTLEDVVFAAGGFNSGTDLSQFEVTSTIIDNVTGQSTTSRSNYEATRQQLGALVLKPYDKVVFHNVYSDVDGGVVTVAGEVRYPGSYTITRGERLSSLIARAGGYTSVAYPYGAVFTRKSVAERQELAYQAEADDIESAAMANALAGRGSNMQQTPTLGAAASLGSDQSSGAAGGGAGFVQTVTARLRSAHSLGRLSVIADPKILAEQPEADIVLEPGDSLTVPRRSASVNVVGEVRNPMGVLFQSDLDAEDYIDRAGGTTRLADTGGIFIVLPDGTSQPLDSSYWKFFSSRIAPGSTIVVPRSVDLPTDWGDVATKVVSAISQLAITAASIAVIARY